MSGGLMGIISVAAGLDLYDSSLAFIIAFCTSFAVVSTAKLLEKFGIDDAVGAVAVHGVTGIIAVILVGVFAGGTPNVNGAPDISLYGQTVCALIMAVLGFVPGYGISYLLKKMNMLRVRKKPRKPVSMRSKFSLTLTRKQSLQKSRQPVKLKEYKHGYFNYFLERRRRLLHLCR